MPGYLLLLSPGANRVYGGEASRLGAAECALTVPGAEDVGAVDLEGVGYVAFQTATPLGSAAARALSRQSAALALFEQLGTGDPGSTTLRPVRLPGVAWLPDDLVSIPKYPGKTNEQFTALLLNLTLAAAGVVPPPPEAPVPARRPCVLDPLAGRGTTLLVAWRAGCDAAGVEADGAAFEAMAAYVTTYLRRTRRHHRAETTPVRRDRRKLGRRFDATWLDASLTLTVFTGDTRDSAMLYGKRRFDAVVTDAPYGVVHGAREASGPRDRSPAQLLREALPVWAGQLRPGGALGLSWNTYSLARSDLLGLVRASGLEPCTGGPWDRLAHRVDASIERDLVVAVRPAT